MLNHTFLTLSLDFSTVLVTFSCISACCKFSGCYNLTDIYNLSETPQVVEDYAFQNYCNLHVLPGCISSYESADPWNKFIIIEDATGIDLVNIQNKELFIYNLQGHHKSSADRFMIQNKKKFYVK